MEESNPSSIGNLQSEARTQENRSVDSNQTSNNNPDQVFPGLGEIRPILENFHKITGYSITLLSHPQRLVLFQQGWGRLCQPFHMASDQSYHYCKTSCEDLVNSAGRYESPVIRTCSLGLVDGAVLLSPNGEPVATLILGQVFLDPPDPQRFTDAAAQYGYDQESYLEALASIPLVTETHLLESLEFLKQVIHKLHGVEGLIRGHQEVEARLSRSRESYRSLVRNLPEILMRVDMSGTILAINRTVNGAPVSEVVGSNVARHIAPEFRSTVRKTIKRVVETREARTIEAQAAGPEGPGKAWYEIQVQPVVKNGRAETVTLIALDITRRKSALEALVQSELKYQLMLDSIEEGYSELDLKGNFIFVNDAMCRIYGQPREKMLGLNYREYTKPEISKSLYEEFNRIFRTGRPARVVDYQIQREDGTSVYLQLSASLKAGPDQKPVGFRCISRDVSHIVQTRAEKDKLERKLRQAQKLEAVGTLAGGVAHDFNNLLTGLQGNVSLMLREMDASHPHYERIRSIEEYVAAATGLTRQLLGFARGGKYEVKTLDVNKLVDKTLGMFGRARKDVTIHRDFMASRPVEADGGQMEQVLLNLYVNAWQAMPSGGDLYVQTQDVNLDEFFVRPYNVAPGKYTKISVTDTGLGMDEATQQKVFDPFFTTKDVSRGTGLGLSSAYGIINNHQGIISVYSAPGKGATFNIFLPSTVKELVEEGAQSLGVIYGSETVLLVDDEQVIIKTGGEILEALGYRAILADHARAAVDVYRARHQEIDMVILDMIMPDMTGEEVYEQLRLINPKVRVLLSSGYSLNGQAVDIMKKGCNGFIQKPFNLEQLSHKLREILD